MPNVNVISVAAKNGGVSQAIALSVTSAQSAAIPFDSAVVTPTVDCFFRQGGNPTALADGTDQILMGGNMYRIGGISPGNKLAFIVSSGTGTVYITPDG